MNSLDNGRDLLLVVAPHPDDETLGAGGLLHQWTGPKMVLCCTLQGEHRRDEMTEACNRLGASWEWLGYEQFLDGAPSHEIVSGIERVIRRYEPAVVFGPSFHDSHQEHRVVASAVMSACRPVGGTGEFRPRVVGAWEQVASSWVAGPMPARPLVVELSIADLAAKVSAYAAHKSQTREAPGERSVQAITTFAELRGHENGVAFAETYELWRFEA